jgi:hypothetical protein
MSGTRPYGIRSGDLSEELGILLLNTFSAVVPVPRQVDVGIDVVATLLRRESPTVLVAEESFYVQLKSVSVRTLTYEGQEVRWLEQLQLPLFIGSVDKATCTISLYSTNIMYHLLLHETFDVIRLHLDPAEHKVEGRTRDIPLGEPILRWTTAQFGSNEFANWAYSLMKTYVQIEQRNIKYRPIRRFETISYHTNQSPYATGTWTYGMLPSGDRLRRILEDVARHLIVLSFYCREKPDLEGHAAVLKLVELLRNDGVEVDASRLMEEAHRQLQAGVQQGNPATGT